VEYFWLYKMNIYNDSNFSGQTNLPSDANFSSVTSNSFIIPNGSEGDLLFLASDKEINGLAIGPNKYVLASDGTIPEWSNSLDINTMRAIQYNVPGTVHGDLFTVDNSKNLERVPIGNSGDILTSTGTEFAWQPLDLPNPLSIENLTLTNGTLNLVNSKIVGLNNQFFFNAGNTVGTTPNIILEDVSTSVVQGFTYKIHFWGKLIATSSTNLQLSVNNGIVADAVFGASTSASFLYIYAPGFTGNLSIKINGSATLAGGSLTGCWCTLEQL
jgi:hypothetical protein